MLAAAILAPTYTVPAAAPYKRNIQVMAKDIAANDAAKKKNIAVDKEAWYVLMMEYSEKMKPVTVPIMPNVKLNSIFNSSSNM